MPAKPYKTDTLKKEAWLKAYEQSECNFSRACKAVYLSRCAIYDALQKDKKFAEKKAELDNKIDDKVEGYLLKHAERNYGACIFWLTNRRKMDWRNTQKTELSGDDGGPINFIYAPAKSCKKSRDKDN